MQNKGEGMTKEVSVAVIDIGSGKISGFVASQLEGDDFNVVAQAEVACSTFYQGRWIDESDVMHAISSIISQLADRSGSKPSKIYVGIPGEFSAVATKKAEIIWQTPKKIMRENLNELFDSIEAFNNANYSAISRSSIYFELDDQKRVNDPIGEVASKLSGLISFIFCDNSFKRVVTKAVNENGITEVDFVPQNLAQALYLIQPSIRDEYAVLVDCGYVTTSVSVVLGDGILYSKSFSIGGAQMVDDLSQVLDIDYPTAENLMSRVHLNLDFADEEVVTADGKRLSLSMSNEIVRCRVEDIAEHIIECINGCPHKLPEKLKVFVTGGAFAYLKGGYNTLARCLNMAIYPAQINLPQYDKQEYTSAYGLIGIALSQCKPVKKGFFKKLLSGFGG